MITSLSSFLTATHHVDAVPIAQLQLPILNGYVEKTAKDTHLAEFHQNYQNWAKEMACLAQRA